MLRLYDTRHRLVEPLLPSGSRSLRMYTRGPDLRTHLLTDLIRRVLERSSVRVAAQQSPADDESSLRADTLALNMRPVDHQPLPARPIDLLVGSSSDEVEATHRADCGRFAFDGKLGDVVSAGLDPLSVRLALMEHHYRTDLTLTWDALRAADQTIRHWRGQVAEWAESLSAPIAKTYQDALTEAFEDDLDTPRALKLFRDLAEDPGVSPGARFETAMHADHILALDLAIDIGKPR
ncbi:nucleotidyl transferase family protein [Herbidospora sp. RD11066]